MSYKMFSPIGRVCRLIAVLVASATMPLLAQAGPKKDPPVDPVFAAKTIRAGCVISSNPELLHRLLYFYIGIGHFPKGVQSKLIDDMFKMSEHIFQTAKPVKLDRVNRTISLPPIAKNTPEPQDFYEVQVTIGDVTGPMYTLKDCLE